MSPAEDHRHAADRHDLAARGHERAAGFWAEHGDADRAQLQHEMAEYERQGAQLERRWADLVDPHSVRNATQAARLSTTHVRREAKRLSAILSRTAETLERSAELADAHALRREGEGEEAQELRAAKHARDVAERARQQADQWLKMSLGPDHDPAAGQS